MDHHCPWLNNCVGFKNRKTFMLLIIYAFLFGVIGILGSIYPLVLLGGELTDGFFGRLSKFIIGIVGDILGIIFVITMINFLTYHFDLVNNNKVNFIRQQLKILMKKEEMLVLLMIWVEIIIGK